MAKDLKETEGLGILMAYHLSEDEKCLNKLVDLMKSTHFIISMIGILLYQLTLLGGNYGISEFIVIIEAELQQTDNNTRNGLIKRWKLKILQVIKQVMTLLNNISLANGEISCQFIYQNEKTVRFRLLRIYKK